MRRKAFLSAAVFSLSSFAAAPEQCSDLSKRLDAYFSTRQVSVSNAKWSWKELADFHAFFLEAMALDPANVPTEETPDALLPENLNVRVKHGIDSLVRSRHIAEKFGLESDFDAYLALVNELLDQREEGLYTRARRTVKRGALHSLYTRLAHKLQERGPQQMDFKVAWSQDAAPGLVAEMHALNAAFKRPATRAPASIDAPVDEQIQWIRSLFWVLIPLVFLTGLSAGLLWSRQRKELDLVDENSEPKL
jgi:hypothetical protein